MRQLLALVLTAASIALAWAAGTMLPDLLCGTFAEQYRHFVWLLGVFVALSVMHAVLKRIPGLNML